MPRPSVTDSPLACVKETSVEMSIESPSSGPKNSWQCEVSSLVNEVREMQETRYRALRSLVTSHEQKMSTDFSQLLADIDVILERAPARSSGCIADGGEGPLTFNEDLAGNGAIQNPQAHRVKVHSTSSLKIDHVKGGANSLVARLIEERRQKHYSSIPPGNVLQRMQHRANKLVFHPNFDRLLGILIVANAALIGLEAELTISGRDVGWINIAEVFFLAFYTLELLLKFFARGFGAFRDTWFRLDFVIVVFGLVAHTASALKPEQADSRSAWWEQVMLIRMFRLMRLIRAFRMMKLFRSMWSLVYGLIDSFGTMLSTLSLLSVVLFMYSCVGIELITKDPDLSTHEDTAAIVAFNFGDMSRTMLTMMQFVSCDSIAGIYMPLVIRKPVLGLYFISALVVISIALMNLVTATLVEGALSTAAREKLAEDIATKEKLRRLLPTIVAIFKNLDKDGSGELTLEEMEDVHLEHLPKEFKDKVSVDSMKDMFEVLDTDGTGRLSEEEFVEGLVNIALLEVSLPTIQLLKQARVTYNHVLQVEDELNRLKELFD
eukprot:TRINITY_DN21805_c0_g2_i1.p1 TRINITY_DN21805_c0_g2~~TRINITY_DN21805_c0_g2_i1.p1  ORF type:complete len:549 (+),score=76.83 TRINITY_DN21805_c0_g2_i1:73-1719(+)